MSNLTSNQLAAFSTGQAVRQVWSVVAPVLADHSSYTTTVIDDGVFSTAATPLRRVVRAGSRDHKVWNPHPMVDDGPDAVRYVIEAANGDGYFHRKSGSPWNPFGIYDASPMECFLLHQIYVWDRATSAWSNIAHMDFKGRIVKVDFAGSGSLVRTDAGGGTTKPGFAPNIATITAEQVGAWETMRRVFSKDDGHRTLAISTFTAAGTSMTLTSISPSTKVHGAATFNLTCTGTGFSTRAHVYIDGVKRTTNYSINSSGTEVIASILAADIATAGTKVIQINDPCPGGGWSNTLNLTVT